jgi:hypothetical protein
MESSAVTVTSSIGDGAKALGAFYTDIQISDFLVWWAIRSARDTVMDPSFGGGVFLRSACNRLLELGGKPTDQVFGVEVDPSVHKLIVDKLRDEFAVRDQNFVLKDFFDYEPLPPNRVTALVGNPPFIRYQRFGSEVRARALAQAADHGVRLTQLSSSWAPFVVHGVSMVKTGGRLAMVLPMEIAHASYALPVLKHLLSSFRKTTFLTFRKKLFADLSEDTLLMLAEGKGEKPKTVLHRDLEHAGILSEIQHKKRTAIWGTKTLHAESLMQGQQRLIESLIPKQARDLYKELKLLQSTARLGEFVDIGIGYVTGANDFFHLSPDEVRALDIPKSFLRPAVRKGRALSGLRFTRADWKEASAVGDAAYLLFIERTAELPLSVKKYLDQGKTKHVPDTYKCRVRSPWYSVPRVYQPDGFLTYMSGIAPRFVSNDAGVVAPNSLHIVRRHAGTALKCDSIAALWQTSLTRLSVEVEGHSLGGGMLKLEPSEAENCIVPNPGIEDAKLSELSIELDALVRASKQKEAQQLADKTILQENLGLSKRDCVSLQNAAQRLVNRRYGRTTAR